LNLKIKAMKKAKFKTELKRLIEKYGYWSEEVKELNSKAQSKIHYHIWLNWHNEVKAEIKN